MTEYYLAVDIGASSGRHILGHLEDGRMVLEEVYRFPNGMKETHGHLCWDTDELFSHIKEGMKRCKELGKLPVSMGIDTWAVVGSQTAINVGYGDNWFLVIFVGVMTGVGGGLLRDVMANMTPMIFCKRIYAIAALAGSLIYVVTIQIVPELIAVIIGTGTVFIIRTLASARRWDLPVFVLEQKIK